MAALSNTPTEAVFDDNPRKDSLIFSVHLWNPLRSEPTTMAEVFNRHKDVQYSSRIASQIVRQQQIHRLRDVTNQLTARLPESERNSAAVKELSSYGCQTRMHVVRLLVPQLDRVTHTKDIDHPGRHQAALGSGLRTYEIGLVAHALGREFDPLSGVVFHEYMEMMPRAAD